MIQIKVPQLCWFSEPEEGLWSLSLYTSFHSPLKEGFYLLLLFPLTSSLTRDTDTPDLLRKLHTDPWEIFPPAGPHAPPHPPTLLPHTLYHRISHSRMET